MSNFKGMLSIFIRFVAFAFVILAVLCLSENSKLLERNFVIQGNTLHVPLFYCSAPYSIITVDETTAVNERYLRGFPNGSFEDKDDDGYGGEEWGYSTDTSNIASKGDFAENAVPSIKMNSLNFNDDEVTITAAIYTKSKMNSVKGIQIIDATANKTPEQKSKIVADCSTQDLLFVNSTMLLLCLSALIMSVCLAFDVVSRTQCCVRYCSKYRRCITPSMAIGMTFVVAFIVSKTGISMWTLVQKCQQWEHIYQGFIDSNAGVTDSRFLDVTTAKSHGNVDVLAAVSFLSFITFASAIANMVFFCSA